MDLGSIYGYTSTDMFIQALKTVAKKGKSNITPENVQKAASTMKWQIEGLDGPEGVPEVDGDGLSRVLHDRVERRHDVVRPGALHVLDQDLQPEPEDRVTGDR